MRPVAIAPKLPSVPRVAGQEPRRRRAEDPGAEPHDSSARLGELRQDRRAPLPRRFAVRHRARGRGLSAGDTPADILEAYPWLEPEDIQACLHYAYRLVAHERIQPSIVETAD